MKTEIVNRLVVAAQAASAALREGATPMERGGAQGALDRALLEMKADAERSRKRSASFDGVTFDPAKDGDRLKHQLGRVFTTMNDGHWRTLAMIALRCGDRDTEAAISARLRDLRKPHFGGYVVERRRAGAGVWEYRVLAPDGTPIHRVVPRATETLL